MKLHYLLFPLVLLTFSLSKAEVVQWTGGGDGFSWRDRLNWSEDTLPNAGSDVVIPETGDNAAIKIEDTATVKVRSVESDALLEINAVSLTLTGPSELRGGLILNSGSLTVEGPSATLQVAGETEISNSPITASKGGNITFADLEHFTLPDDNGTVWEARDPDSSLNFLSLTHITGNRSSGTYHDISAVAGGTLSFPALTTITQPEATEEDSARSGVRISVMDNSQLSAPVLSTFEDFNVTSQSHLHAYDTGDIEIPALEELHGIGIDLNAAANPQQFTSLTKAPYLRVNSGTVTMTHLASVGGIPLIEVSNGGKLVLPGVVVNLLIGDEIVTAIEWIARGAGSELVFPNMTTITGDAGTTPSFDVRAQDGGTVSFPSLTAISNREAEFDPIDGIRLTAEEASTVSAPLLKTFHDETTHTNSYLKSVGSGMIDVPELVAVTGIDIDLNGAAFPRKIASIVRCDYLHLNGGSVILDALETVAGITSIKAYNGGKLDFPNLSTYETQPYHIVDWTSEGMGSELRFPALVTLTPNLHFDGILHLIATEGGQIHLSSLTHVTAAYTDVPNRSAFLFKARSGSLISAPALHSFSDPALYPGSSFRTEDTGIVSAPQLLAPVGLSIDLNAESNPGRFTSLTNAYSLTINRGTVTFESLESIDDLISIGAYNGAIINFHNISTYTQHPSRTATWAAIGERSEINFLDLESITGPTIWTQKLEIFSKEGGSITFPALRSIRKSFDDDFHFSSGIILEVHPESSISAPTLQSFYDEDPYPNSRITLYDTGSLDINESISLRGVDWDVPRTLTVAPGSRFSGGRTVRQDIVNNGIVENRTANSELYVGGSITGPGDLRLANGATITLPGLLKLNDPCLFTLTPTSKLRIWGSLDASTTLTGIHDRSGTLFLGGNSSANPQQIEVMSRDLGATLEGFRYNNAYDVLVLGNDTNVRLVDRHRNTLSEAPECLYANTVIVPEGTALSLGDLKVYARVLHSAGLVAHGSVTILPDSGPIALDRPTPGVISEPGERDEWIFFGRAGKTVNIVLTPKGPSHQLDPFGADYFSTLGLAEIQVITPAGVEISRTTRDEPNEPVQLPGLHLPIDGAYMVTISANSDQPDATGNYDLAVWDSTPDVNPLILNQTLTGFIETPHRHDQWSFPANEGEKVRLDLISQGAGDLSYTFSGPDGWIGLDATTQDSNTLTLPATGHYTLSVSGTEHSYDVPYAFQMVQTTSIPLPLDNTLTVDLLGKGQAEWFRLETNTAGALEFELSNEEPTNRLEMYVSHGRTPTREAFDYASTAGPGANRKILIPMAPEGVWHVLIYAEQVPHSGEFTLQASHPQLAISSIHPEAISNDFPATLMVTGVGFGSGISAELVSDEGESHTPAETIVDSPTQLNLVFTDSTIPPGNYTLRLTHPSDFVVEHPGLQLFPPGEAQFEARLICPNVLTPHSSATFYIEAANTGNAVMAAPTLVLRSADPEGDRFPLLTLDPSSTPQQPASEIQLTASGKDSGQLHPGERIEIPVFYHGLSGPTDGHDDALELELRYSTEVAPPSVDEWPLASTGSSRGVDAIGANQKIGPGYGSNGWVQPDSLLPYRIQFENIGVGSRDAQGESYTSYRQSPIQRVLITDQLQADVDWESFRLTEIAFGETVVPISSGQSHYSGTIEVVSDNATFNVLIEAGIDYTTGRVTASLASIDPETALPPSILNGLLPAEDGTGRGRGHLGYTVRLKEGLSGETAIRNVALIHFDAAPAIATDQINPQNPFEGTDPGKQSLVTTDDHSPLSTITELAPATSQKDFMVEWSGSDVGAGIANYDIYVAVGDGPWLVWKSATHETSAIFKGEHGQSYHFFSVARDHSGNLQPRPNNAQATTLVGPAWRPEISIHATKTTTDGLLIQIDYEVEPNFDYVVEVQNDLLNDTPWEPLPGAPHNTGSATDLTQRSNRFYRLTRTPLIEP